MAPALMTHPRPDLALIDDGLPRLRALAGWLRMLSHAPNRDMIQETELDDALSMIAAELDSVGRLLTRFQEQHEL